MPFPEKVKHAVRRRSHFRCCLCQKLYAEAHHIIPDGEGPDTFDNAAPLCPNHHTQYGNDPRKRKWITEGRDWWYEQCDNKRYTTDPAVIERLQEQLKNVATKEDLRLYWDQITDLVRSITDKPDRTIEEKNEEISYVTTSVTSVVSVASMSALPRCLSCGNVWPNVPRTAKVCPNCGSQNRYAP